MNALSAELQYKISEAQDGTPAALLRCAMVGKHQWLLEAIDGRQWCTRCRTALLPHGGGYRWPELSEDLLVDLEQVHPRLAGESVDDWLLEIGVDRPGRRLRVQAEREGIDAGVLAAAVALRQAFPDGSDLELAELCPRVEAYLRSRSG